MAQPAGPFVIKRIKAAYQTSQADGQVQPLLDEITRLEADFGKDSQSDARSPGLRREDLKLICFEYVSG